jgi:2-dehydro-3-deoxyphosphogluconate aldolase/(4S)-4-hydroxy-2-oxoglutarate aldolase
MATPTPHPTFASPVVPVVVIEDPAHAVPLARALLAGGIDVIEVTLRTSAALPAIEAIARACPDMAVGAGTVTTPQELQAAKDAGAQFALSPAVTPALLQAAAGAGIAFIPGVATLSEALLARDAGFSLLKLFPARVLGGAELLKAWYGPLPGLRFCPTGGLGLQDLPTYLSLPNVAMVGGSWLTPADTLRRQAWDEITALAAQSLAATRV